MNKIFNKFVRIYLLLFVTISALSFSGCENNAITPEAKLTTLQDLVVQPGFAWFVEKKANYKSDPNVIQEIKNTEIKDKIYLFVKPTCSCVGTQTTFPSFMRILEDAGVTSDKYELYFMSGDNDKHPYQSNIQLTALPSFFVKKGDKYYSIIDTMNSKFNTNPTIKIEEVLLDALK